MTSQSFVKRVMRVAMFLMCITFGMVPRVHAAGAVWAWGRNVEGQLGNGTNTGGTTAVPVSNLGNDVTAVAGGFYHSLAVKSDGSVWAWGSNGYGQLGNGNTNSSNVPVQVSNLSGVIAIASVANHCLAVKSDGSVWAWGSNEYGQLGNGSSSNTGSNVPVQVSNLSGVIAVACGLWHSLAVKSDGSVWAWGYNAYGQLGNGTNDNSTVPVQVSGLSKVTAVAGGFYHSLALKSDGTVWAWGDNFNHGELGNGTNVNSNVPVQVSNLSGVIAIASATYHSLALKSDGSVWAWGANDNGQLGDHNKSGNTSNVPVSVDNLLSGFIAVACGAQHSLELKGSDGSVWAWGGNGLGQLGYGNSNDKNFPGPEGLTGVIAIAAGDAHSLAIRQKAPTVSSITPNSGANNNNAVNITNLAGTAFLTNATVKLSKSGENDINATNVKVVSSTQITCTFDLTGKAPGQWDVVVTNTDSQSGTLAQGFTITNVVTLTGFFGSNTAPNNGPVGIQVAGTGILPNPTFKLTKQGQPDIVGTGIYVLPPPPGVGGTFDLTAVATGQWDVVVINTDGSTGTLPKSFTITNPAPTVKSITPNSGTNNGSVNITNLAGAGFLPGASVKLSMNGADIAATNVVVVNSAIISCTFDLSGKATGQYDVVVTNTDNQSGKLAKGFTINPPSAHDVAVTAFSASPNPVSLGQSVTFSIKLKNLGTSNESGVTFKVTTTLLNKEITIIGPIKIAAWKAGQELSGSVKIPVPKNVATGDYLINAQLSTVVGEVNIDNNKQTLKLTVTK